MAQKTKLTAIMFFLIALAAFFPVHKSEADAYQQCQPGADCVLGEFLFGDSTYVPVITDVCTATIHDPAGNLVVNGVHTTFGAADGWHAYTFNASNPEGLYRATMCCTVGPDKICKDKSFMLQTPASISGAATQTGLDRVETTIASKIDNSTTNVNSNIDSAKNGIFDKIDSMKSYLKKRISGVGGKISKLWKNILALWHF